VQYGEITARYVNSATSDGDLVPEFLERYGEMLTGKTLYRALGFSSVASFRHAVRRGAVPVPVFQQEARRGYFASTRDVALWISSKRRGTALSAGQGTKKV
jgi:hypothetical protein